MAEVSEKDGAIRSFIAVEISDEVRSRIGGLVTALERTDAAVKWVRPKSMHLTLRFLGNIFADRVPSILEAMAEAAAGTGPFEVEVKGFGAFPPNRRPRVYWLGIEQGAAELAELFDRLEPALIDRGLGPADKRFSPHLTLGRVKSDKGLRGVDKLLAQKAPAGFGVFRAKRVVLFQSELKPSGAVYTVLGEKAFGE